MFDRILGRLGRIWEKVVTHPLGHDDSKFRKEREEFQREVDRIKEESQKPSRLTGFHKN